MTDLSNPQVSRAPHTVAPESLDPTDWEGFRETLHEAADRFLEHVRDVASNPVWRPVSDDAKEEIGAALRGDGLGAEGALTALERSILPYGVGNPHPRFMGWVHGAGTSGALIAALAEAAMNVNAGGREHGAIHVEKAVIRWAADLFDLPGTTSGILTSGTSMANLIALTAARDRLLGREVRTEGLRDRGVPLRAYATAQTHESVAAAFDLLGLGTACLQEVDTLPDGTIDVHDLDRLIRRDRDAGLRPFAVIATAGTVDTGAVDDLAGVAGVAARHGLWFHVDGAFGALVALSPTLKRRLAGVESADSIAFDFHKWMHVTYDCGCVLVRDGEALRDAFAADASYLARSTRGLAAGDDWPCDRGPELSRGFRALRVWFTLAEHGAERLGEAVEQCCRLAGDLEQMVAAEPDLELLSGATLNIVCFRVRPLEGEDAAAINTEIVTLLHERGIAAPSTTRLDGDLAIRACLINHRTTRRDLEITVAAVLDLAAEIRAGR